MRRVSEGVALSVVLACTEREKRVLPASIAAVQRELSGLSGELILVASPESSASISAIAARTGARSVESAGFLVPELWRDGWRASLGDAVAFLIPECHVAPGWARALLRELEHGAGGAGGYFALDASATSTDAAIYFLRYASFSDAERITRDVVDIAGDNAIYRRDAMMPHAATFAGGFWEVDLHRRFRAEGVRLVLCGDAVAKFSGAPGLVAMSRQRLTHGRHFGAWRASRGKRPAWITLALAPAVPAVLVARIVRRVWSRRHERLRLLTALPALSVLSCAWALGETIGALAGPPVARA